MAKKGEETALRIKIGRKSELHAEISRFLENPALIEEDPGEVLFLTPEQFTSIFSANRVETLKTIENSRPRTMTDLVKILKRPKESVSRDIGILSRIGIIEVDHHGLYRTPRVVSRSLNVSF